MEHATQKRYKYIMDLFRAEESLYEARREFRRLNEELDHFAKAQPHEVQDLIYSHMRSYYYLHFHLFHLACKHLRLPEEQTDCSSLQQTDTL